MTRRVRTAAAGLLVISATTVLAACGSGSTDPVAVGTTVVSTAVTPGNPTAQVAAAQVAAPAGAAEVMTVDGRSLRVPSGRPSAVFFFSVGCGECVGGVKSLGEVARSYAAAGAADFLLVDMDPGESAQIIAGFQRDTDSGQIPAVVDRGATLTRRFNVASLSTLIVLDAAGTVTWQAHNPSAAAITEALQKAGAQA